MSRQGPQEGARGKTRAKETASTEWGGKAGAAEVRVSSFSGQVMCCCLQRVASNA